MADKDRKGEALLTLVRCTGRRLAAKVCLELLCMYLLGAWAVLLFTGLFDSFWPLPLSLRATVLGLLAVWLLYTVYRMGRVYKNRLRKACLYLDRRGGEGRILGAFELRSGGATLRGNPSLVQAEINAVNALASRLRAGKIPYAKPLRTSLLLCALGAYLVGFAPGAAGHQARRVVAVWLKEPPLRTDHVLWLWPPAAWRVPPGSSVKVEVSIKDPVGKPVLCISNGAEKTVPLQKQAPHRWAAATGPVFHDSILTVIDGPFLSEKRRLQVRRAALIEELTILCRFPSYTGLPPRTVTPLTGRITVLAGSELILRVKAPAAGEGSWRLAVGAHQLRAGTLRREGETLTARFSVSQTCMLSLQVGEGPGSSRSVLVECVEDQPPRLQFLFPPPGLVACWGSSVTVQVAAQDDFGLSQVAIAADGDLKSFALNGSRNETARRALQVPEGAERTLTITAFGEDTAQENPHRTELPPRLIRVVSPRTFRLLRQAEAVRLLYERLKGLQRAAKVVRKEASRLGRSTDLSDRALRPLVRALRELSDALDQVKRDPLFTGEQAFAASLLQKAEGLRARLRPPQQGRRSYLAQVRYFVEELLLLLEDLLPEAAQAAQAQPFFQVLSSVLQLSEKQQAILNRLRSNVAPQKLLPRQQALQEIVRTAGLLLVRYAPGNMRQLAGEIAGILAEGPLRRTLSETVTHLQAGGVKKAEADMGRLVKAFGRLQVILRKYRVLRAVSLAELLRQISAGMEERRRMGLAEEERLILWGPGVSSEEAMPEAPPELGGALRLGPPELPQKVEAGGGFWKPFIEQYRRSLAHILTKEPGGAAPQEDRHRRSTP